MLPCKTARQGVTEDCLFEQVQAGNGGEAREDGGESKERFSRRELDVAQRGSAWPWSCDSPLISSGSVALIAGCSIPGKPCFIPIFRFC